MWSGNLQETIKFKTWPPGHCLQTLSPSARKSSLPTTSRPPSEWFLPPDHSTIKACSSAFFPLNDQLVI